VEEEQQGGAPELNRRRHFLANLKSELNRT